MLTIKQQLETCVHALHQGRLTPQHLQQIIDSLPDSPPQQQDLLYLQAQTTDVRSPVLGMTLVLNGQVNQESLEPDEWPYKSVLEAIQAGWRVIQFPNLALLLDESRTYGLGCEFILEKWS